MNHIPNAFYSDRLYLSFWDLFRLACGFKIQQSALIVERGSGAKYLEERRAWRAAHGK